MSAAGRGIVGAPAAAIAEVRITSINVKAAA